MAAVVGTDVAGVAAVVVGFHNVEDADIAVAVAVGGLGEVAVGEVLHVADVRERDAVAVGADDVGHVVLRVCAQRARAQAQAVVRVVHHGEEAADGFLVHQQARQAENIPRGIVLMDGHFDAGFVAGRQDGLEEIPEVFPQLLLGDRLVRLEQLVELCHALRLPAGEGQAVQVVEDVACHLLVVVLDFALLVVQGGGAVRQGMEQVGACPVKDGHEVVGDDLNAELCQITQGCLVVFDVLVAARQTDLDVVVHVYALYNVHVEACALDLAAGLLDLLDLPYLTGLLAVQRPYKAGHARDLLDLLRRDAVVALAIPAECHFHWGIPPLCFLPVCSPPQLLPRGETVYSVILCVLS